MKFNQLKFFALACLTALAIVYFQHHPLAFFSEEKQEMSSKAKASPPAKKAAAKPESEPKQDPEPRTQESESYRPQSENKANSSPEEEVVHEEEAQNSEPQDSEPSVPADANVLDAPREPESQPVESRGADPAKTANQPNTPAANPAASEPLYTDLEGLDEPLAENINPDELYEQIVLNEPERLIDPELGYRMLDRFIDNGDYSMARDTYNVMIYNGILVGDEENGCLRARIDRMHEKKTNLFYLLNCTGTK